MGFRVEGLPSLFRVPGFRFRAPCHAAWGEGLPKEEEGACDRTDLDQNESQSRDLVNLSPQP